MSLNPECPKCGYMSWVEPLPQHESHAGKTAVRIAQGTQGYFMSHPVAVLAAVVGGYALTKWSESNKKQWKCTRCEVVF